MTGDSVNFDEVDPARVVISRTAVRQFCAKHPGRTSGGPTTLAEPQIRRLLADMIKDPRTKVIPSPPRFVIRLSGYRLIVSADRQTIVSYQTDHKERTWDDVKAGIPSAGSAAQQARKNARRGVREVARLRAIVVELGGTVEDADRSVTVTGPSGQITILPFDLWPGGRRHGTYAMIADATGLADLSVPDGGDIAGWLAVD